MKSTDKLKAKMLRLGISKAHVARLIKCSRPHLYKILKGEREFSDTQKKILKENQLI